LIIEIIMSSPLEIDQGAGPNDSLASPNDDATPDIPTTRRGKRDQVARPQSYSLSSTNNNVLSIPFVFFYLVLQALYHVMSDFVGDPAATVREFFATSRETNDILNDLPGEQHEQQRQIHHVHEQQVHQRQKLQELQLRIERIEDRRRAREAAAAAHNTNAMPDLKMD
jgi:hypothetical protein